MNLPESPSTTQTQPDAEALGSSLRQVGNTLSQEWQGLDKALLELTEEAAFALQLARVSIWTYDEDQSLIRCLDGFDAATGRHSRGEVIEASACPAYFRALSEARLIDAEDARSDPRTRELRDVYLEPSGVGAMLDAPLWLGGRMVGVVCGEHVGPPRKWSEAEKIYASTVGMVAAQVLATSEREAAVRSLVDQDQIYRRVFETSPVPLAQFDLSTVHDGLRAIRERVGGDEACHAYLEEHPEELAALAGTLHATRLNAAALSLYESASEDQLRGHLVDLVLPESLPVFRDVVLGLAQGVQLIEGETTHRTMGGNKLHVRILCHLPKTESARDPMVVSVLDLTEEKLGEGLLREIAEQLGTHTGDDYFAAAARFMAMSLRADLAFVGTLVDGDNAVRSLAAYRDGAAIEEFRYALEGSPCKEVVGHRTCIYPERVCEIFPADEGLTRLKAQGYLGSPIFASDGRPLGIVVAAFRRPLKESRRVESALRIIASRAGAELERTAAEHQGRRLEEQLMHAQRLESVGRLAGGVAHDFNNLLAPILAYSEMALEELTEDHPIREDLEEIMAAANRASQVTGQLLAFSRRQVLEMATVDLNDTLEGFGRMIRTVVREDIQLALRPTPGIACVRADRGQIEQVLLNLVLNAQDAMPTGGRLSISTRARTVVGSEESLPEGSYVCVEVADTGTGMDEFTASHIFDPFFTTKGPNEGTGLGLAMVYGIIQQHGGDIQVKTQPGEGSVFSICLPACAEDEKVIPSAAAPSAEKSGSERVMVVEDEVAVRRLIVNVLRRRGYDVIEADTPLRGLELALDHQVEIDLLVTDVVMPQMDGVELYRRISLVRPALPVLYLSGYAYDVIAARGVTKVNLLEKPFSLRELSSRVRELLDEQSGRA